MNMNPTETIKSIAPEKQTILSEKLTHSLEGINHKVIKITNPYKDTKEGEPESIIAIEIEHNQELPVELPAGFGFSGGVARSILLKTLGEKAKAPRDLDIVAIRETNPDISLIENIGKKYMPDDYEHGYGVGLEYWDKYFLERDFTINEVLILGNKLIVTPQALEDTLDKTVRPTRYESKGWKYNNKEEKNVHPKLALKALRLISEMESMHEKSQIEGIENWVFKIDNIPPFFIALQLEKAFERGDKQAVDFLSKLAEKGLDFNKETPQKLAEHLRWLMLQKGKEPFEYSKERLNKGYTLEAEQPPETKWEKYADMAKKHGSIKGMPKGEEYFERGEHRQRNWEIIVPLSEIEDTLKKDPNWKKYYKTMKYYEKVHKATQLNQMEIAYRKGMEK